MIEKTLPVTATPPAPGVAGGAGQVVPEQPAANGGIPRQDDQASDRPAETAASNLLDLSAAGNMVNNNSILANNIHESFTFYQNGSDQEMHAVRLSPQHFRTLGPEQLESCWAQWELERCEIEAMADELGKHRILILCGEPELGKTSMAILLAARLRQRLPDLQGASLCRAIDGRVQVDPDELMGKDPRYHCRALILKNAFLARSSNLKHFAARLADTWSAYQERLQENRSFLLLTTETNPAPGSDLERLKLLWSLGRPRPQLLAAALRKLTADLATDPDGSAAIECWLAERADRCAEQLGTLPRVSRFVRDYLLEVAVGRLSFEQALERMDDLGRWLLEDLPQDPDAWCAALALTLCSAASDTASVSWMQFDQLRRDLDRLVQRELRSYRDRRQLADLCRGCTALERARADVLGQVRFPSPHLIQFRERRDAGRLWHVLLTQGRPLLGMLTPHLIELTDGDDPGLRQCAARALGRLGQVDPLRISLRLMRQWARKRRHELLGQLLQGTLGSDDPDYRQGCLGWLDGLLAGDPQEAAPTAVASLRDLAYAADDHAMDKLKAVALARFELQWGALRDLATKLHDAEAAARSNTDRRQRAQDLEKLAELGALLLDGTIVPEPALRLLAAFQYALKGMVQIAPDLGPVLSRLAGWMRDDPDRLGPLVAFLFLREGGVAGALQPAPPAPGSAVTSGSAESDWLREALDERAAPSLCLLLAGIYHHLRPFPGLFRNRLQDSFGALLASWASVSRPDRTLRPAMVALLAGLFAAPDPELSAAVLRMAKETRTSTAGMAELQELAVEAITTGRPAGSAAGGDRGDGRPAGSFSGA